jgi:hypothetical protein
MDSLTPEERLMQKVDALVKDRQFDADEMAILKEIIEVYHGVRALGRMSRAIIVSLGLLVAFLASWDTVAARLRQWLAP